MSFDALLTLLFILLFVVGPLLRRISGGQQNRPPAPRQPGETVADRSGSGGGATGGDSAMDRRLAEARRRVQEAMTEATRGSGPSRPLAPTSPTPTLRTEPAPSRALDWQASARVVQPFLEARERVPRQRESMLARRAAEVSTERRSAARRAAKLQSERRLAFDRNGIVAGMIWHEILSEPVSRRGTRRMSSRLRSR